MNFRTKMILPDFHEFWKRITFPQTFSISYTFRYVRNLGIELIPPRLSWILKTNYPPPDFFNFIYFQVCEKFRYRIGPRWLTPDPWTSRSGTSWVSVTFPILYWNSRQVYMRGCAPAPPAGRHVRYPTSAPRDPTSGQVRATSAPRDPTSGASGTEK
jgi:hypothetical protein